MSVTRHSLHTPAVVALWLDAKDAMTALARALRHRVSAWQRQRKADASLVALLALSETNPHLLRDLGLNRGELLSMRLCPDDATRARFNRQA